MSLEFVFLIYLIIVSITFIISVCSVILAKRQFNNLLQIKKMINNYSEEVYVVQESFKVMISLQEELRDEFIKLSKEQMRERFVSYLKS